MPKGFPDYANVNFVYRSVRFVSWLFVHSLFKIEVQNKENIPAGSYIVTSNHLSWVDPFLFLMLLPAKPHLYFMGAAELTLTGPRWRAWVLETARGIIPVDRSKPTISRDLLKEVQAVLNGGGCFGLFPEGKEGNQEGQILPLKRGITHFAIQSQRPVLVCGISGTHELFLGKRIRFRVGPLLTPPSKDSHQADEFLEQIQEALVSTIPPLAPNQPSRKRLRHTLTELFH